MAFETVKIGPHTLIHGDCLEVLPTLGKVDAVVTDPPYGLGEKWNGGAGGEKSSWRIPSTEAKSWDMETVEGVERLPDLGQAIIWGGNYYALPPSRCWLIWDKCQPDTWTTGQCELAWTNIDKPVRAFRMCQAVAHDEMRPKEHPTQKPLSLLEWCMKWIPRAKVVLDPYCGTGTTIVACQRTGRIGIGIEKERKYFDIACRRVEQAVNAEPLWNPETKIERQTEMFAECAA